MQMCSAAWLLFPALALDFKNNPSHCNAGALKRAGRVSARLPDGAQAGYWKSGLRPLAAARPGAMCLETSRTRTNAEA